MFAEFEWSATDYQHRTVEEILVRRAGNCAEQALVLNRLLRALDIDTREIAEINIQPPVARAWATCRTAGGGTWPGGVGVRTSAQ